MEGDPVVVTVGQDGLDTPAAEAIADDLEAEQDEVLADIGADACDKVNTYTSALNGFSSSLTYEEAQALAADPKVELVLPDELYQATTDAAQRTSGSARGAAGDSGVTGEDVVVGVIDNGIWPEHPSFADDGSYGPSPMPPLDDRARPSCEFGNTAHNPDDVPFTCNNKLLGARQMLHTSRALIGAEPWSTTRLDDDGHGTRTASTAAGKAGVRANICGRDLGEVSGIAPRARGIAYKGLGALGVFSAWPLRSTRPSSTAST